MARRRATLWVAAVLGASALVWAAADLGLERVGFAATVPPKLRGAEEAASVLARLFGALVLCLYPSEGAGRRLHWVASGLVLLGAGHLFYGYLAPLFDAPASLDEGLLAGLVVRTLSCVLFVVGLAPATPPRFSRRVGLGVLVDDVRASAAAERDGFALAPRQVPVAGLLSVAASYAEALPGGHRFSIFDESDGIFVLADPGRIGQVLRNLIHNAAKYSPAGSEITLRAEPMEGNRSVRLSVMDWGLGIHPDDLERVFEKFGRGRDPDGRRVGGVGLGLYLSRQIARSHGSDLTVRSAPGDGSAFAFELEASARTSRRERR
ncbi:MAG: ATP-binding protein [Rubrobacteraceae bacterium]|nr:ATP-binding protein [Rubrobacteraceae bacterium]